MRASRSMRLRARGGHVRGLTLIELLLVTAILGMVVSLGAGAAVRAAKDGGRDGPVAGLAGADASARLLARREGPQRIAIDRAGWWLVDGDQRRALWTAPAGLRIAVRDADGRLLDALPIDAAGRGPDFRIELADQRGVRRFRVLGLSGQWVEIER